MIIPNLPKSYTVNGSCAGMQACRHVQMEMVGFWHHLPWREVVVSEGGRPPRGRERLPLWRLKDLGGQFQVCLK